FIMFFVGYRKAKASGALLPSVNERRRKMRVIMICLPFIVLVWLIIKWPRISKLRGEDIWIFAIVGLVTILGLLGLYFWLDKKLAKRSESEAEDTQNDGIPSAAKPVLKQPGNRPQLPRKSRDDSEPESTNTTGTWPALMRYRRFWFWAMAVCFAAFAIRSFCWLFYIDGSDYKIQSPNNLGDLSLHLTLIKNFANGVPIWPDSPIYVFSKLRYPAGIDLFNGLLSLVHVDLIIGLVWVGLLSSLAIFYGFYRWGGTFAIAGFLFNGGIAGFQFFKTFQFLDYQGTAADIAHRQIAWKSIVLSMLVTQRGWLYAIPAGLVLLWH